MKSQQDKSCTGRKFNHILWARGKPLLLCISWTRFSLSLSLCPTWPIKSTKSEIFGFQNISYCNRKAFQLPSTSPGFILATRRGVALTLHWANRHTEPSWRCGFYSVWTACVANRNVTPEKTSVAPPLHRSEMEAGPWLLHNNRKHCRQQRAGCAEAILSIHAQQGM